MSPGGKQVVSLRETKVRETKVVSRRETKVVFPRKTNVVSRRKAGCLPEGDSLSSRLSPGRRQVVSRT